MVKYTPLEVIIINTTKKSKSTIKIKAHSRYENSSQANICSNKTDQLQNHKFQDIINQRMQNKLDRHQLIKEKIIICKSKKYIKIIKHKRILCKILTCNSYKTCKFFNETKMKNTKASKKIIPAMLNLNTVNRAKTHCIMVIR